MNNNEITNVDFKKESTYEQDFNEIKNELIDKLTKLFNEFITRTLKDDANMDSLDSMYHILFLTSCLEGYYNESFYESLDLCVNKLLYIYRLYENDDERYEKEFTKYKQSEDYVVQSKTNIQLN